MTEWWQWYLLFAVAIASVGFGIFLGGASQIAWGEDSYTDEEGFAVAMLGLKTIAGGILWLVVLVVAPFAAVYVVGKYWKERSER